MCRSKDSATAYFDEGQIEIQIPYANRSHGLDRGINGKWYDVRLMHSEKRSGALEGPDCGSCLIGQLRTYDGYCMGEHCYNRFSIDSSAKGMDSHKRYYSHGP